MAPEVEIWTVLEVGREFKAVPNTGKRKSRTKPPPKKRLEKLDGTFNCPFCNHEMSVVCVFDRGNMIAEMSCGIFQESYNTLINNLTEAIDVYREWIDTCERVNDFEDPAS